MTMRPDTGWSEASGDLRKVRAHPDYWYPVAWSREAKPGQTCAVHFAGEPIVLVRPRDGTVFALEDRCAHRQVPLSKGSVDGCTLRCGYHGWRYDAEGRCTAIPGRHSGGSDAGHAGSAGTSPRDLGVGTAIANQVFWSG